MAVLTIDTQIVQTTANYTRVRVIVYATGPIETGETGSVTVYGTTRNVVNDTSIQMTESQEDGTIEIYNELLNINARNGSYGGRAALIKAQLGTSKKEILQAFNCRNSVDVFIYPTETGKIYYGDTINIVVSQSNNNNSSASVIARCAKVDTSQYYPNNSKNFASITIMSNRTTTGVVQWTIPNTWLNYITDKTQVSYINGNAKSGSVLFEVEASEGIGAVLGLDMTPTIYVPESIVPVIGNITYRDGTGLGQPGDSAINAFVQNVSSVEVWAPISGQYGAQIRTVKAFYGEKNVMRQVTSGSIDIPDETDPFELGTIAQTGDMPLTIIATDSRGRSFSKSVTLRTSAYTTPICVFQASRWNVESAHESDYSTVVRLTASGQISIVNGYTLSATLTIQGRKKGSEVWTTIGTASISGNYDEIFTKSDQSIDEIYEYQIVVIDELGFSVTSTSGVGRSTPILEFHASGKGMGIGTVAPETGLSLGMELDVIGSQDDGYSRIKISDPDHTNSTILANLSGDTLRILDQLLGIDRAFVGSHLFLDNNIALGGVTTSGGQTPILRMNTSNQVELTWTSGGLKGRVTKEIWSGTLSKGGSVTIPELPYYNLIAAKLNTSNELVYSYRPQMVNSTGTWYLGHAEISGNVQGGFWVMGATLQHTSPTKLTLKWAAAYNNTTFYSEYSITAIYGIL